MLYFVQPGITDEILCEWNFEKRDTNVVVFLKNKSDRTLYNSTFKDKLLFLRH